MANVQNFNKEFGRIVKSIRWFMPYLAVALLLAVYSVSSWAEGFLLSHLVDNARLAYCIGFVIQFTRGTLIFFPQLNPMRPMISLRGELIAIGMGLISVGSIVGLVQSSGMPIPVAVSLSILMLAGVGVEIFLLKEIKFTTHMELFRNREWWLEIQEYYLAERKLAAFLEKLRDLEDEELGELQVNPAVVWKEVVQREPVALVEAGSPTPALQEAAPAAPEVSEADEDDEEYPDEFQRQRYLRAASNNLRSAIELEGVNAHKEAAQDYELADEYIRLAYPAGPQAEFERVRRELMEELVRENSRKLSDVKRELEQAGGMAPLDLTGNGKLYQ